MKLFSQHEENYVFCKVCLNTAFNNRETKNEFYKDLHILEIDMKECCYIDSNLLYNCKNCNQNLNCLDFEKKDCNNIITNLKNKYYNTLNIINKNLFRKNKERIIKV